MYKKIIIGLSLLLLMTALNAQDCNSRVSETTPDSHFTSQGNGTVLDTQTNLIWKRCSEGQSWNGAGCIDSANHHTWAAALNHAQTSNHSGGYAGHTDWRVPNIKELNSIVERACYSAAVNLRVFHNTGSHWYWSSSPYVYSGTSDSAWAIDFRYGSDGTRTKNQLDGRLRLVRDAQ